VKLITDEEIRRHVTLPPVIEAIEAGFLALAEGRSVIFPVVRGHGSDPAHFFAIKSGLEGSTGLLGLKAGSYNPSNRSRGLPAHTSTTMLVDDTTGAAVAVVEAGHLNGMRTAAANAIATRLLARRDATTLGVIGAGAQARYEIEAVLTVRAIRRVLVASRREDSDQRFKRAVEEKLGIAVEFLDVEDVVRQADILVTVTPSREPVLAAEWVRPGTHISAMGADNVGKMELPLELIPRASLYVDDAEQAARIGEAQHAVAHGLVTLDTLRERSLGAALGGRIAGRTGDNEITIFDSSGLAIQDIAAASVAYRLVESSARHSGRSGTNEPADTGAR
jgi:ornithine cyclodeaminase/alanine dehydrogenase-like protein (mu-crystallin family)